MEQHQTKEEQKTKKIIKYFKKSRDSKQRIPTFFVTMKKNYINSFETKYLVIYLLRKLNTTKMELRDLTRAEEEVMQILWNQEPSFVKDILEQFPEPRPAYNTVSTIIRILEQKGFVGHKAYGKTHEYFSLDRKSVV